MVIMTIPGNCIKTSNPTPIDTTERCRQLTPPCPLTVCKENCLSSPVLSAALCSSAAFSSPSIRASLCHPHTIPSIVLESISNTLSFYRGVIVAALGPQYCWIIIVIDTWLQCSKGQATGPRTYSRRWQTTVSESTHKQTICTVKLSDKGSYILSGGDLRVCLNYTYTSIEHFQR